MKVGPSADTTAFMFLSGICKLSCFISRFQSEGRNFTTQLKCIRVSWGFLLLGTMEMVSSNAFSQLYSQIDPNMMGSIDSSHGVGQNMLFLNVLRLVILRSEWGYCRLKP